MNLYNEKILVKKYEILKKPEAEQDADQLFRLEVDQEQTEQQIR